MAKLKKMNCRDTAPLTIYAIKKSLNLKRYMYCQAAMGLYEKQNKIRTMIPKKSHLPKVTPTWVEQTITYILNNSRDALHSELVKMFYLLLNSPVIFRL